jgi:hypothetical protein
MKINLSRAEIDALIGVSGDVDPAHFECYETKKKGERAQKAFDSAIEKLQEALTKLDFMGGNVDD